MAETCREVHEWIEEKIEKPVEEWVEKRVKKCKKKKCKKWCLCCNKWFCWIETFLEKVITWIVITVGKWVTRVVCEVVAVILDGLRFLGNRLFGAIDFVLSLFGFRPTKYLRLKIFILVDLKGNPIHDPKTVQSWLDETIKIFKDKMNIEIHTANQRSEEFITVIEEPAPAYAVFPAGCSLRNAYGLAAEYYESNLTYTHTSSSQYILDFLGYGSAIYAYMIHSFNDNSHIGCSYPVISDYSLVARDAKTTTLAHEMCHLCGLFKHHSDEHNLMNSNRGDMDSDLTNWQITVVRNSKYVTYLRT